MTFLLEIFIFMMAFWLVSEFIDGINIKGAKSLLIASLVYFIALVICKVVFTILLAIFTLGLMPFFWVFSYALSAYVAFAISVAWVQENEVGSASLIWGVIMITVSSSVLRFILL